MEIHKDIPISGNEGLATPPHWGTIRRRIDAITTAITGVAIAISIGTFIG